MTSGAVPPGTGPLLSPIGSVGLPLASLLTIAASLFVGFANAETLGQYGVLSLALVAVGVSLVWVASWPRLGHHLVPEKYLRPALGLPFMCCILGAVWFRGGLYGKGSALSISIALVTAAAIAALVFTVFRLSDAALASTVLLIGGACIAMVIASPAPRIDVWGMFQAVARGLMHGHNLYTQRWSPHLPGQATIYAYFPGAAVVLTAFYALFGDVRVGLVLALLASAILVRWISTNPNAAVFGSLFLLYPLLTFSVEQSWSEPLSLLVLLLLAWAVRSQRMGWAVAALAVLLTFQQYDLVFVPLTAAWSEFGIRRTAISVGLASACIAPWALAAPHSFIEGTIMYNLQYRFAYQSLSVFHLLSGVSSAMGYLVLIVSVAVALVVAMKRLYRGGGFLMECGLVLMTLDFVDKVSRFNEWELAAGLVLAAGSEALGSSQVDKAQLRDRPPSSDGVAALGRQDG